tara:strand:- start:105 stop:545 length:441 start_codon:yes stop_codon:yes gene_type:complete
MKLLYENKWVIYTCRFILGIIFIYASIDKIANPLAFSDLIDNYHIIPSQISNLVALIIPWIELFIGLCFILGILLDGACFISAALLFWFIFILSQALYRGIDLNCGCFDLSEKAVESTNLKLEMIKRIVEDLLFLVITFVVKNRKK